MTAVTSIFNGSACLHILRLNSTGSFRKIVNLVEVTSELVFSVESPFEDTAVDEGNEGVAVVVTPTDSTSYSSDIF
jgi:hypothetical protein